jgi:FkbM family methyltransferase
LQRIRDWLKHSRLYPCSFCLRYCLEKLAWRVGRRKSFAEYDEDLAIENLLGRVNFFVDIGANDGLHSSNTFYFALRGARGICFEPVASIFQSLAWLYSLSHAVTCRRLGISDENREVEMVAMAGMSYLPETQDPCHRRLHAAYCEHARKQPERVSLRRFPDALPALVPAYIDLLSIDVEGHELKVARSIPFAQYRFGLIVVETHQYNSHHELVWRHRDYDAITALLAEHGYLPVMVTAANTLYGNGALAERVAQRDSRGA